MSTFPSEHCFRNFVRRVRWSHRYTPDAETERFFGALIGKSPNLQEKVPNGFPLWRAQIGHDWEPIVQDGEHLDDVPAPFKAKRMMPPLHNAKDGRANPKGIRYHLYLATHRYTAMAEVRPWIGALVSVAQFQTTRELNLANVTNDNKRKRIYTGEIPDHAIDDIVLREIDEAFSEPVSLSDDTADYAPTQIIAEIFKANGFDGVAYRSAPGDGHNIVLFDLSTVAIEHCYLFEVRKVSFTFEEAGRPY